VRAVTRRNSDGTPLRYLQLAHNEWDPATKTSRPRVVYSLGRADQLDRQVIERLLASLCRLLDPAAALSATATTGLSFVESRAFGGAWILDQLWRRLGIGEVMGKLLTGTRRDSVPQTFRTKRRRPPTSSRLISPDQSAGRDCGTSS